nr:MAG TPA: hypothetical protein [Caudoviricetes sp.]
MRVCVCVCAHICVYVYLYLYNSRVDLYMCRIMDHL